MAKKGYAAIVTCEHGGNSVPAGYANLFTGQKKLLESHRGYDHGALELARKLASYFGCPLFYSTVTRLLVDLNRSPDNPRRFSEVSRALGAEEKKRIETSYYLPYRDAVTDEAAGIVKSGAKMLHVSVHSFVPVLNKVKREADIGLLYDPGRKREAELCARWREALRRIDGSLAVRRNYPYRGVSDGLATHLRGMFGGDKYIGIELEVNQKFLHGKRARWLKLMRDIEASLERALRAA